MQITLKINGDELFAALSKAVTDGLFPQEFRGDRITWELVAIGPQLSAEDLLATPDSPCVFLLQAHEKSALQEVLQSLTAVEKAMSMSASLSAETLLTLSPVVLVLGLQQTLRGVHDLPDVVSDWVFAPLIVHDLVRRIFATLKRKRMLQTRMSFGPVVLSPATRMMFSGERSMRLSPSEFVLAEFFFTQMGSVVSSKTLERFFESKGKSTQSNNIRVAIFQLRLKLETLTSSQVTLANIYRKGYCLRLKSPRKPLVDMHRPGLTQP